jgi:hypothetical protein
MVGEDLAVNHDVSDDQAHFDLLGGMRQTGAADGIGLPEDDWRWNRTHGTSYSSRHKYRAITISWSVR